MSPKTLVKPTEAKTESSEAEQCTHHWVIDPPDGPTSMGRCKRCGEKKEFYNYVACSKWDNASSFSVRHIPVDDDLDEEPVKTTSRKRKQRSAK